MNTVLYMAPVMGVTGCIYRNVYSSLFKGYDLAIMPFIENNKVKKAKHRDVDPERNDTLFGLIPQILENKPRDFIRLAGLLYDTGYKTVNWNLGCPISMVRKKIKGAGLLSYHERIHAFIDEVTREIPSALSIKVRLGNEDNRDLSRLLPMLDELPLKEIIIHPRTGKQMYEGKPDLDIFEECLGLTRHTVVYSGDIHSVKNLKYLKKRFPAINRWMIGRGGITNPFLPEEIKGISPNNRKEYLPRFIKLHEKLFSAYKEELSGPAHLIGKMKEVWRYWVLGFEGGKRFYLDMARTKTEKKYLETVDRFFQKNPIIKY